LRQRCGDSVTADDDANVVEAWPMGFVAPMFSGSNIARAVSEQAPKISQKLRRSISSQGAHSPKLCFKNYYSKIFRVFLGRDTTHPAPAPMAVKLLST